MLYAGQGGWTGVTGDPLGAALCRRLGSGNHEVGWEVRAGPRDLTAQESFSCTETRRAKEVAMWTVGGHVFRTKD
jgi:hypothetical protein